ncbi:MAG: Do family serine endopeptidase [Parachlamydia sp.]|nr:Do family serine endopeptidase [Parachlamydia sp.]
MFRPLLFAIMGCCLLTAPSYAANGETLRKTSMDFRDVAKKATPAVVSIKVKGIASASSDDSDDEDGELDDFWQRFFGVPKGQGKNKREQKEDQVVGQASGFIVSSDGEILTNSHVVKDMTDITVLMNNGKEYSAKVIGQDANTDIALIKIDAKDLPYLKLGDSSDLEVGEWVVAIGNPMGLQASLTVGVVSAKGRNNLDLTRVEDYIQTDAAINRGNSGGPLLTLDGEVAGMNTAIVTSMTNGGYMGIGFAIPSNLLNAVMNDLKTSGSFQRGFIGVALQSVDNNLAQSFGLDSTEGALVAEVTKDSPAEKAGLKQGDIIQKFNNLPVTDVGGLRNAVAFIKAGTKVPLVVLRNGKPLNLSVEIGSFPATNSVAASAKNSLLGIQVENLTSELTSKLGSESGVMISGIQSNSPLAWAGVRKGAVILEVNQKKIANVDEFNKAIEASEKGKPFLFLIKQGDSTRYISFKVG